MKDSTALTLGSSAIVRRRIYFTMIEHPYRGWIRVGPSYGKRATAKGWLPFVRRSWHGLRGKVLSCPLVWRDGRLDEKSVRLLDSFNMDAYDSFAAAAGDWNRRAHERETPNAERSGPAAQDSAT